MNPPKRVVKDSAASRKSLVEMALSLAASIGTSTKDFCKVSSQVLPGGMTGADMIAKNRLIIVTEKERKGRRRERELIRGELEVAVTNLSSLIVQASTDMYRINSGDSTFTQEQRGITCRRSHSGFSPAKTAAEASSML